MRRTRLHDGNRFCRAANAAAYTLVELLIVIAIMGIFVGLVLTRFEPSFHDQLLGAAQVVSADLALVRSLAVGNNSKYRLTFEPARHRYWIEHSGTNPALNTLPDSPYRDPTDPVTRQTTNLRKLPSMTAELELAAVRNVSASNEVDTNSVEYIGLGSLNQTANCWIWLATGRGDARRFVPIEIDSVTGLTRIGDLQVAGPPALNTTSSAPVSGS